MNRVLRGGKSLVQELSFRFGYFTEESLFHGSSNKGFNPMEPLIFVCGSALFTWGF